MNATVESGRPDTQADRRHAEVDELASRGAHPVAEAGVRGDAGVHPSPAGITVPRTKQLVLKIPGRPSGGRGRARTVHARPAGDGGVRARRQGHEQHAMHDPAHRRAPPASRPWRRPARPRIRRVSALC
jgi:hypothetical protein